MVIYSRMLTRFYCCLGFDFILFLVGLRVVQIGLQNGMVEWYKSGVKQGICVIDSGEVDHEHEVNPKIKIFTEIMTI